jgi:hypothetical protein
VKRRLKFLVVLIVIALIPLRAVAAITVGLCAVANQDTAAQVQADHDHGASHHHHGQAPEPRSDGKPDCSVCAEHCTSGSFVVPSASLSLPAVAGPDRVQVGHRLATGFVPEHLDPPPLAL